MISNTDNAWASVEKLRTRASYFLTTTLISALVGVVAVMISVPTALQNFGYKESIDATGWIGFGIFSLSVASSFLIAWVFAVSMANHSEVVYFSSASNIERAEPEAVVDDSQVMSMDTALASVNMNSTSAQAPGKPVQCPDCGASNDAESRYCTVCSCQLK